MVNFLDKQIFSPDKEGRKPTILVNIADDDVTRGDTAGRLGLARAMAKKIDADILYADEPKLNALYPDTADKRTPYQDKLALFLSKHRSPDIVLGLKCETALKSIGKHHDQMLYLTHYNESLSSVILNESNIVSHHLTDEMLIEEGDKFDKAYPDLKKPIIAVFLVNPERYKHQTFTDKITSISKQYKEATIFLCGSRRTSDDDYLKLKETLEKNIKDDPLKSNIDIAGFRFDRSAEFNPYRGLIARADHFILWGESMSMMSEPLITGKTVHLYDSRHISESLRKMNIVTDFNDASANEPMPTQHFPPVNITEQLADKLIQNFKKDTASIIQQNNILFARREYPKYWHNHLTKIYTQHQHFNNVPKKLQQNTEFIKAALEQNGMAIKHLPIEIRHNPEFGQIAVANNEATLPLIGDDVYDDNDAMFRILNSISCMDVHKTYKKCSDRLKSDKEISLRLLKSGVDIGRNMDQSLFEDRDICLFAAEMHSHYAENIPSKFMNDQNFVKAMLQKNPYCFQNMSEKQQNKQLDVILKEEPSLIQFASEKIRDDEKIMLKFMEKDGARMFLFPSDRLKENKEFVLKSFEHHDISHILPVKLWRDKDILLTAIKLNSANKRYAHHSLMDDPDICKACLRQNPRRYYDSWEQLTLESQGNPDICITALEVSDMELWYSINIKLHSDKEFLLRCAELPKFPLKKIDPDFYSDIDFINKLIKIRPEWKDEPELADVFNVLDQKAKMSPSFNTLTPTTKEKEKNVKKKTKQPTKLKV